MHQRIYCASISISASDQVLSHHCNRSANLCPAIRKGVKTSFPFRTEKFGQSNQKEKEIELRGKVLGPLAKLPTAAHIDETLTIY